VPNFIVVRSEAQVEPVGSRARLAGLVIAALVASSVCDPGTSGEQPQQPQQQPAADAGAAAPSRDRDAASVAPPANSAAAGAPNRDAAAPIAPPASAPAPVAMDAAVSRASGRDATAVAPAMTAPDAATAPAHDAASASGNARPDAATTSGAGAHVFVIAIENEMAGAIYGSPRAPYINGVLLPTYASAGNFQDELPADPSEPHYIWMEAGTNTFADHMFVNDDPPSATNSTASPDHLVSEIRAAGGGRDWMTYQEGLDGAGCPIAGRGTFVPRHDPFLFFRDLVGEPPSASAPLCATHHRPLGQLNGDLASGGVASYVFITPDLCHDMHGSAACPAGNVVRLGDAWLSGVVPPLLAFVTERGGVVFIVWDEGDRTAALPFIALGPHVRPGYRSVVPFNHGSLVRSVERILSLPVLPTVQAVSDLGDLFQGGVMP